MAETGTEMSCLMLRPSSACASGMLSRMCHSWRAWFRLSATTASLKEGLCRFNFDNADETIAAQDRVNALVRGTYATSFRAPDMHYLFAGTDYYRKISTDYYQCRTDPDAAPHAGLSEFIVDLHSPGVEIRTIHDMSDDRHFCEVHFSDVRVPADLQVGTLNGAFKQIMRQMEHERGGIDRLVGGRPHDAKDLRPVLGGEGGEPRLLYRPTYARIAWAERQSDPAVRSLRGRLP